MDFFRRNKADILVALFIFALAMLISNIGSKQVSFYGATADNVWFQADVGRVYANMTARYSNHYRTKVHPLFSLATNPVIHVLYRIGLKEESAVRVFVSFIAGLWLSSIYLVLRLVRLRHLAECPKGVWSCCPSRRNVLDDAAVHQDR